ILVTMRSPCCDPRHDTPLPATTHRCATSGQRPRGVFRGCMAATPSDPGTNRHRPRFDGLPAAPALDSPDNDRLEIAMKKDHSQAMKSARTAEPDAAIPVIEFQSASHDIWDKKYRLKTKAGEPVDDSIEGTYA